MLLLLLSKRNVQIHLSTRIPQKMKKPLEIFKVFQKKVKIPNFEIDAPTHWKEKAAALILESMRPHPQPFVLPTFLHGTRNICDTLLPVWTDEFGHSKMLCFWFVCLSCVQDPFSDLGCASNVSKKKTAQNSPQLGRAISRPPWRRLS